MNLHQALSDISEIKAQLERTQSHRGFRSLATVLSGFVAVGTSTILNRCTGSFRADHFVEVWIVVALIAIMLAVSEMLIRTKLSSSNLHWTMHKNLGQQFAPALLVGGVITWYLCGQRLPFFYSLNDPNLPLHWAADLKHLLPGVWGMLYGLGIVACVQHLPAAARWIALWFIVGGVICLVLDQHSTFRLNQQMAILFGGGQVLLGAVLFWNMERVK